MLIICILKYTYLLNIHSYIQMLLKFDKKLDFFVLYIYILKYIFFTFSYTYIHIFIQMYLFKIFMEKYRFFSYKAI